MDFGQSLDPLFLSQHAMTLPGLDTPEEKAQLERLSKAGARSSQLPKVYVGVPIFSHSPWVGNFYPEGTEAADFLRAYSKQLSTVELNSTFYAIPSAETFLKWKKSVGSDFRFCPKFPKSISHSLDPSHADLKTFSERVMSLEENLGACFLQLPNYFSSKDQDRLKLLLQALPRELKAVVEFRNPDFFTNQRLKPEWVDTLARSFIGSVSVDTPLERAVAHVSLTSTRIMVRFLGANLHDSDFTRLKEWAKRLVTWYQNGIKEVFFLVHEPDNSFAPEAAKAFIEMLNLEFKEATLNERINPVIFNHLL